MRSSFYTLKLWRREAFTQTGLLRTEVFTRKLYTEKLWHREASKQSIFYTQKHLHAQKLYIHTELLHTDAFTHRSLFTELTDRRFDAERPLHRAAFTHRRFYTEMHRAAFVHKRPQAFTHRSFYTQALHREASTQSIFQTQKHLHTKALHTHKLYTHTPVHTELLHTDAFTHRSLFTEQGLHRAAFTQREAFAQSSLYNLIHTETLNTQMPKLLHRQVFTHRGIYTKVLHTDAADASTHRSFWTQMPFHTEAFTQRGFDIYTPMHTEAFRHRWFFRESQKLWHREAFTQRIFYTQKLLHTQAFPQKLLHREAFEHELLHTDVFTNRRLVHTGLLRTEAFTQRSLYTQTLSHRKTDSTEQLLHTSKRRNFTFLTFGHHIVRRGCIRRWKIAILDVGQSFCVKWVAPDLVKSHFYTSFISRETVVPDDPKWIKSQFYTNSWTFASDVKKSSVFPQLLPFSFHATLASELSKYTSFWWLTLISCEGAAPGPAKFAFCHVFGCPTCAISVSADGCCGPKDKQDPHFATRLGIRHAAEGNVS